MSNEKTLFVEALAIGTPEQRQAFLDRACGDNAALRAEVEALLAAHERAASFLESPPRELAPTIASTDPALDLAGATIGHYKLLERIGEGGMGVVYMAEQFRPVKRRVALKIIKPGLDTKQTLARFEAERQALAMMDHASIAKVFDAGATDTGRPYFVMELVRGVPITEYCDQHQLTPRHRLELFIQVCQAVQHAHQKGIIHRDIKPNNVLVTLGDGDRPIPKIIDFGIAKATGEQRLTDHTLFTEFRQLIGTPLYMSPEQAERSHIADVDTRSDVYSLGVLLYELLTGTTPFDKQRLAKAAFDEVRRIIREEDPPRPSTRLSTLGETITSISAHRQTDPRRLSQTVRGELDWIVMKAMEKDRSRRYETASAFSQDVERFLCDQPVVACPPSRAYRVKKAIRRNRTAATAAAFVTGVLLVATTFSVWAAIHARHAQATAVTAQSQMREQRDLALTEQRRADQQAAVAEALNGYLNDALVYSWNGRMDDAARLEFELKRAEFIQSVQTNAAPATTQSSDAALAWARGALFARHGHFREAADNFARAIDLAPDEISRWHQGIPLLLQVGDADGYRRRRVQQIRRFADTHDALTAHLVVKDALILPLDDQDPRVIAKLADRAAVYLSPPWNDFTKGIAEYRLGNFERAIPWLARASISQNVSCNMESMMFLAMACQRAGHPDSARIVLDKGGRLIDARQPDPLDWIEVGSPRDMAQDWVLTQFVRREAETLINKEAPATQSVESSTSQAAPWPVVPDYEQERAAMRQLLEAQVAALSSEILASPRASQSAPLAARGDLHSRLGLLREAVNDYAGAIQTNPGDHDYWRIMPLLLALGDTDGYRQWRGRELQQFKSTLEGETAHRVAKESLVIPLAGEELKAVAELADRALVLPFRGDNTSHEWAGSQTKGMAEYRNGHYREALRWLSDSMRLRANAPFGAEDQLFAAMAHERLGEHTEAQALLGRAAEAIDSRVAAPDEFDFSGLPDFILLRVVRQEAEALINKTPPSTEPAWGVQKQMGAPADRGRMQELLGEYADAAASYSVAIKVRPRSPELWAARGNCYRQAGDFVKMREDYAQAALLDPRNQRYFIELGRADILLGNHEQSILDHSSAIALSETNVDVWLGRGMSYEALGQWPEAIKDYSRIIEIDPHSAGTWFARARVYSRMGKQQETKADVASALRNSDGVEEQNDVAWALATSPYPVLRDPKTAVAVAERAVKLRPLDQTLWNTLGVARYRVGDYAKAVEALEKSRSLHDEMTFSWDAFFLAMAHWQLGHKTDARNWYDQAAAWMEKNAAHNDELLRFRAEAEALIAPIARSTATRMTTSPATQP